MVRCPIRGIDSVTWGYKSANGFYDATYASSTISNVLVHQEQKLIRKPNKEEVMSNANFACVEEVEVGDQITFDSKTWPVLVVNVAKAGDGKAAFREVFF